MIMDRRKFIQGATAVTAGLAAPFVWTGSASAQQSASRFYKGYVTDGGFTFPGDQLRTRSTSAGAGRWCSITPMNQSAPS